MNKRGFRCLFRPHSRGRGRGNPSPNDSLQASLSPPVGGRLCSFRRDWLANKCSDVLNIITYGYVLPFISKPNLVIPPLIRSGYKALQKERALASCIQSLLSKNAIERVENVKSLGFLQLPVSSPQASPNVEASNRPKQAQHLRTCRKVQNGNSRVHQALSDSRGMCVVYRLIRRLLSHSHSPKLKEIPKVLPLSQEKSELKPAQVFSFVGYEYHLDSALVKPTQERWLKLQDLILRLKSKHV